MFETQHAGRGLVEGQVLQFRRVRGVIGRDGVDDAAAKRVAQSLDVARGAQRRVDLEDRVVVGAGAPRRA